MEEIEDDELLRQFDTNLFGLVRLVRAVTPTMRARGSGTIVNVSSVVTWTALPFSGAYTSSKAALSALTECLHYELAPFGIRTVLIELDPYPATRFLSNVVVGQNSPQTSP